MKQENPNPYLSWTKASLEAELKLLQKLRGQYIKEMDLDDDRLRQVVWKAKQVNQSLAMLSKPKLQYIQGEGTRNEVVYDLDTQEIRFTHYPNLVVQNVAIVPNKNLWSKIKTEK